MGHRPRRNKARRMHIISRNSCCHSRRLNGLKPDHQSFYHLANTQYHVKSKVCGHYLRLNVLKVGSSQQAWCKDGCVDFVCLSNCTMLSVMPGTWPYPCQKNCFQLAIGLTSTSNLRMCHQQAHSTNNCSNILLRFIKQAKVEDVKYPVRFRPVPIPRLPRQLDARVEFKSLRFSKSYMDTSANKALLLVLRTGSAAHRF